MIKAEIADDLGALKIAGAGKGIYFLNVSSVGYISFTSLSISLTSADVEVPGPTLHTDTKQLNEVKITASKPLIEVKNDRLIFNVEGSINATGCSFFNHKDTKST